MSAKQITLKEWIESEGVATIARALKVTDSCVRHWRRGWVLPDTPQMRKIRVLSKGMVSIDMSVDHHFSRKNKKNRYEASAK